MTPVEQARFELIEAIDVYNRGITHCPSDTLVFFIASFVFAVVVTIYVVTDKKVFVESPFTHTLICLVYAWLGTVLLGSLMFGGGDDDTWRIYKEPRTAINYGCMKHALPIRLNPLFEDKEMFDRIYQENNSSKWHAIVHGINTLKRLTIEYNTMNVNK